MSISLFGQKTINLKTEFSKTLLDFTTELQQMQVLEKSDTNFGAIICKQCNIYLSLIHI